METKATMDTIIFAPITASKQFSNHEASIRDYAAYLVVDQAIRTSVDWAKENTPLSETIPGPVTHSMKATEVKNIRLEKIGIVGAGAAGLYAAMILQSLGIDYEILEANNRIGGRLFTHRFNGQQGVDAPVGTPARYDYFDVGAMRFPDMPFMKRLWDLFDILKIKDLFVDYNLSAPNNLKYFNTVDPPYNATKSADQAAPGDPDYFRVSVSNGGTVPNDFAAKPVDYWTGQVYDHYKKAFAKLDDPNLTDEQRRKIFRAAWADLVDQDHHTTRSAMRQGLNGVRPYPNPVVEWLETFDSATGLYDRAFVESVMVSQCINKRCTCGLKQSDRTLLISTGHTPLRVIPLSQSLIHSSLKRKRNGIALTAARTTSRAKWRRSCTPNRSSARK